MYLRVWLSQTVLVQKSLISSHSPEALDHEAQGPCHHQDGLNTGCRGGGAVEQHLDKVSPDDSRQPSPYGEDGSYGQQDEDGGVEASLPLQAHGHLDEEGPWQQWRPAVLRPGGPAYRSAEILVNT